MVPDLQICRSLDDTVQLSCRMPCKYVALLISYCFPVPHNLLRGYASVSGLVDPQYTCPSIAARMLY